jgi:hypothetical protein
MRQVGLAPELESAAAILDGGYLGFQGGPALASAIFGDYNPGGPARARLRCRFAAPLMHFTPDLRT